MKKKNRGGNPPALTNESNPPQLENEFKSHYFIENSIQAETPEKLQAETPIVFLKHLSIAFGFPFTTTASYSRYQPRWKNVGLWCVENVSLPSKKNLGAKSTTYSGFEQKEGSISLECCSAISIGNILFTIAAEFDAKIKIFFCFRFK